MVLIVYFGTVSAVLGNINSRYLAKDIFRQIVIEHLMAFPVLFNIHSYWMLDAVFRFSYGKSKLFLAGTISSWYGGCSG